uniref:C3H1-type domain-containing protein n=1 Tax=Schistocephalus solidus TaxID=70667 RepID=A0A0X3NW06_SCHSO
MIHTQTLSPFFFCAPQSNPLMSASLSSPGPPPSSCSTELVQLPAPNALTPLNFFPSENYQCPTNKNDPAFSTFMSRISTSPFSPAVRPSPLAALPGQKLTASGYPAAPQIIAVRDSQWLKLRVCQAFARSSSASATTTSQEGAGDAGDVGGTGTDHCPFGADSCPLAHPPPNVRVDQDHVTVCFDFMKRSDCRHTNCKYYHPPPHQIEAILKRGDVNKKNTSATTQSVRLQTPLVGQTPGLCWSPAGLAPTLLPAGGLVSNPAAAAAAAACLGSPGSPTVNMAMLAAMRGQQNAAFLGLNGQQPPGIYTPPTMSPSAAQVAQLTGAATAGDPTGVLTTFNGFYQVPSSSATGQIMSGDLLCLSPGAVSSPLAGVSASNQPNPALYMAALMAAAAARQQQTTPTGTSTFSDNLAVSIASMSADRAAHAAASAVNQVNSPGGGGGQVAGRKREAISGDAAASGDGYGVWPPPKRANTMPNGISDGRSSVKTNGGEATDATASEAGATTSLGETGSIPAGGTYTVANSTSGAFVGGGVNYAGIYNMATSAAPGPMSPSSLAAYTSTTDPTNSLANALAFNSILQQQQQAQQQHLAAAAAGGVGALNHLGGGVPPTAAGATNALTLAQQLQQQQVCMALLRLQQQNQLAAMAAAGAGGAYQTAALTQSHPLFSNFAYSAGLSDPLSLQSSAPGLSANAYALQNQPILTNVAYINDEGQVCCQVTFARNTIFLWLKKPTSLDEFLIT